MFKLESYITPWLMGYIDQYVYLHANDFQLSLWGGDAVMNNLDLRLDAVQKAIHLPITVKSGHIHELRIHVPWTKLGSEPVVLTINTIECILKVRRTNQQSSVVNPTPDIPPTSPDASPDVPPSYLQSMLNRINNNIHVIINNFILKFVEDDIVLSINVKAAETYSVNDMWEKAFVELTQSQLSLRKVINFFDLTVCLDTTDASGRIPIYQDPVLYRCSLTCRLQLDYDNIHAKSAHLAKFDVMCERFDLNLSDSQLPPFLRLISLVVALYYGTIDLTLDGDSSEACEPPIQSLPHSAPEIDLSQSGSDESGGGWSEWAWSFMPQILPSSDDIADSIGQTPKYSPAVYSVGLYCLDASINVKLTEVRGTRRKIQYTPFMCSHLSGVACEINGQGLSFFDAQIGVAGMDVVCEGECVCGANDKYNSASLKLFQAGSEADLSKFPNFASNSLFQSCDRRKSHDITPILYDGEITPLLFERELHLENCTENYGLRKFPAWWIDYLYTNQPLNATTSELVYEGRSEVNAAGDPEGMELSQVRCVVGPCHALLSSSTVHRATKLIDCATNHHYEPYSKSLDETVADEAGLAVDDDEVLKMEAFIPTRTYHLTLIAPVATLVAPEHDQAQKPDKGKKRPDRPRELLPLMIFSADRCDLQQTLPMYTGHLVRLVSKLSRPSPTLMHHSYSHTQIKLFGVNLGLTQRPNSTVAMATRDPVRLVPPCSIALYKTSLLLPSHWKSHDLALSEWQCEVPSVSVCASKSQILLVGVILRSWLGEYACVEEIMKTSLITDAFSHGQGSGRDKLRVCVGGVEIHTCATNTVYACTSTLAFVNATVQGNDSDGKMHIFTAPSARIPETLTTFLSQPDSPKSSDNDWIVCTFQLPRDITALSVPVLVQAKVEPFACHLSPCLTRWLLYSPTSVLPTKYDETVTIDMGIAQSSYPLNRSHEHPGHVIFSTGMLIQFDRSSSSTRDLSDIISSPAHVPSEQISRTASLCEKSDAENADSWAAMLVHCFRVIRTAHIQIDIAPSHIFLTTEAFSLSPSPDVLSTIHAAVQSRTLPATFAVTLPKLSVYSASHKATPFLQEIPVRSVEGSVIGDKFPWRVQADGVSLCTLEIPDIQTDAKMKYLLTPSAVACSVGISTKYTPPTSDTISSIGLCLHATADSLRLKISHEQIMLLSSIVSYLSHTVATLPASWTMLSAPSSTSLHYRPSSMPPTESLSTRLSTRSETSGDASRDSPSKDLRVRLTESTAAGVILSLWIQCNLAKFSVEFYSTGNNGSPIPCSKVTLLCDNIDTSLDLHDVYVKVKCKVSTVLAEHQIRRDPDTPWIAGPNAGLILTSSDSSLHRDIHLIGDTRDDLTDDVRNQTTHGFAAGHEANRDFIVLTFTRASSKNIAQRIKQNQCDIATMDVDSTLISHAIPDDAINLCVPFVSEICVDVQPCDFVVNYAALNVLQSVFHSTSPSIQPQTDVSSVGSVSNSSTVFDTIFTTRTVPLAYINVIQPRVFIPKCSAVLDPKRRRKLTPNINAKFVLHDVVLFQFASISVTPQVENPLLRNILNKNIYMQALHAGVLSQLGSMLEDRQYQVDIKAISLSSGLWADICVSGSHHRSLKDDTMVQFPAAEWNKTPLFHHPEEEVFMTPILRSFDLRITAALPIVCTSQLQKTLVCGYSLEVNAVTDISVFINPSQISLLRDMLSPGIPTDGARSNRDCPVTDTHPRCPTQDSGFDSDSAGQSTDNTNGSSPTRQLQSLVPPIDLLLTAGQITLTVYSQKRFIVGPKSVPDKESHGTPESDLNKPDELAGYLGDISSDDQDSEMKSTCSSVRPFSRHSTASTDAVPRSPPETDDRVTDVIPYLYFYISQPHTVLSLLPNAQKFEISCYDISIKGGKPINAPGRPHVLPDSSDFIYHLLETRAGQSDPKTGIPPCLVTFTLSNIFMDQVSMYLRVERPLKLNASLDRIVSLTTLLRDLSLAIDDPSAVAPPTLRSTPDIPLTTPDVNANVPLMARLARVSSLTVSTDQIVVQVDTPPHSHNPYILVCLGDTRFVADTQLDERGDVETVVSHLESDDIVVNTSYEGRTSDVVGPIKLSADTFLQSCVHSGRSDRPKVTTCVSVGAVPLTLSLDTVVCLKTMHEQLVEFYKQTWPIRSGDQSSGSSMDPPDCESGDVSFTPFIANITRDDLKSPAFIYSTDTDCDVDEPPANEIAFTPNIGHMTWTYRDPRVICGIRITPIPFSVGGTVRGKDPKVHCILQYRDVTHGTFQNYCEFTVSESEHREVTLPPVKPYNNDLACAYTWRVIICDQGFIQPLALVGSLCIDSCLVSSIIPSLHVSVTIPVLQLSLFNQQHPTTTELPTELWPFHLASDSAYRRSKCLELTFDDIHLVGAMVQGHLSKTDLETRACIGMKVVEYTSEIELPVVEPVDVIARVTLGHDGVDECTDVRVDADVCTVHVNRRVVHTLRSTARLWQQVLSRNVDSRVPFVFFNHYLICNDTTTELAISQLYHDDCVNLRPRELKPYSWFSNHSPWRMRVCIAGEAEPVWSDSFSITGDRVVRHILQNGRTYTLHITFKSVAGVYTQVIFSGHLVVGSWLTDSFNARVTTKSRDPLTLSLPGPSVAPSFIIEREELSTLALRSNDHDVWSQPLCLTAPTLQHIIKIPLPDGKFIQVWCHVFRKSTAHDSSQTFILLTPLLVIRAHLPHPIYVNIDAKSFDETRRFLVPGQGSELQLNTLRSDLPHTMTFQLTPDGTTSTKSITISPAMVASLNRDGDEVDIDAMYREWHCQYPASLPYPPHLPTGIQPQIASRQTPPEPVEDVLDSNKSRNNPRPGDVPDIDLRVEMTACWEKCNTLLIDVKPACQLSNDTTTDMVFATLAEEHWVVEPGGTFVLPTRAMDEGFYLALADGETLTTSALLHLSMEKTASVNPYAAADANTLYIDCPINLDFRRTRNGMPTVSYMTLTSSIRDGIVVISVQESFIISNLTSVELDLIAFTTCSSKHVLRDHISEQDVLTLGENGSPRSSVRLFTWVYLESKENIEDKKHVKYLALRLHRRRSCAKFWSCPVRFVANDNGTRTTVSVVYGTRSLPLVITGHSSNGVAYFVIQRDTVPMLLVENLCDSPLVFGHGLPHQSRVTVQEETELFVDIPRVLPHHSLYHTSHHANHAFPDIYNIASMPKLFIGTVTHNHKADWSRGIDVSMDQENIVGIPRAGHMKVTTVKQWPTIHVVVQPISKAEISAQEVRARIDQAADVTDLDKFTTAFSADLDKVSDAINADLNSVVSQFNADLDVLRSSLHSDLDSISGRKEEPKKVDQLSQRSESCMDGDPAIGENMPSESGPILSEHTTNDNVTEVSVSDSDVSSGGESHSKHEDILGRTRLNKSFTTGISFKLLTVSLGNENSQIAKLNEMLRITCDDALLACYPVGGSRISPVLRYCVAICCADLQIDNQLHCHGGYDFPVILLKQSTFRRDEIPGNFPLLSTIEKHAIMKHSSLLHVQVVVNYGHDLHVNSIVCELCPVTVYLEDTYLQSLLTEVEQLLPVPLTTKDSPTTHRLVPDSVLISAQRASQPISFESLTIGPISFLLSVHASLTVFIASDQTPLSFGQFTLHNVSTTQYQLMKAIAIHYASTALIRAGLVLGSLDALGNPTGLMRSIAGGLFDLFWMPYAGLTVGPFGFVRGISRGLSSFLHHISAGALTSITNFASTVSRNMDSLCLDSEYTRERNERRQARPAGVSDGLVQGLSHFTMSVLGAVAGLADQPMQGVLQSADVIDSSTAATMTTGFVTGVGKGIVGAVAKPIGGAAELLSQTGQGLLHTTGLSCDMSPRFLMNPNVPANFSCTLDKMAARLSAVSSGRYLMGLYGTAVTCPPTDDDEVVILLTSDSLVVMSSRDGSVRDHIGLLEMECLAGDVGVLVVRELMCRRVSLSLDDDVANKDRVAEYVGTTAPYMDSQVLPLRDEVTPARPTHSPRLYSVNEKYRDLFVSIVQLAQRTAQHRGFPVL